MLFLMSDLDQIYMFLFNKFDVFWKYIRVFKKYIFLLIHIKKCNYKYQLNWFNLPL